MTDEEYEFERNKLVNIASKYADKACKRMNPPGTESDWNKVYFRRVDELAYEKGLISWNPTKVLKIYRGKYGKMDNKGRGV